MFERFTPGAREAVVGAQAVARELGHREIDDRHLLLALLESDGVAAAVLRGAGADPAALRAVVAGGPDRDAEALRALGIDLDEVRRRAEQAFGPGALDRPSPRRRGRFGRWLDTDHLPFTRPAKRALENALRAALDLDHRSIGTEHVLLGVLADEDSAGARALREAGVDLDRPAAVVAVREHLRRSA
ncbi:Clp protease N-terminal domain-containing protein [Kineococcus sp. SYSU DK006]|uniref:Clp protease N-terminal domain-containing protein n=1 Tax=Kineococcus sp. SYSU DK006 TaxID=3383127 RepID=UPI003D7E40A8